jgi:hypothetical protein
VSVNLRTDNYQRKDSHVPQQTGTYTLDAMAHGRAAHGGEIELDHPDRLREAFGVRGIPALLGSQ